MKYLLAGLVSLLLLLGVGAYFGYQYYEMGEPKYKPQECLVSPDGLQILFVAELTPTAYRVILVTPEGMAPIQIPIRNMNEGAKKDNFKVEDCEKAIDNLLQKMNISSEEADI